jgi:SSS family solute:Na+ symporter
MPAVAFAVYIGVQWWAAWYPGAEPGGGGYVAQRIFSARSEREGVYATLWFNVAHYCVRSWPWILTALACVVLYPRAPDPEGTYVRVMIDHLPPSAPRADDGGLPRGVHVHRGHAPQLGRVVPRQRPLQALRPPPRPTTPTTCARRASPPCSPWSSSGVVTRHLDSVGGAWKILLALGSGTGLVLILRWYWWRINAWSEISRRWAPPSSRRSACATGSASTPTTRAASPTSCSARSRSPRWCGSPSPSPRSPRTRRPSRPSTSAPARPDGPGWGPIDCTLFGVGKVLLHEVPTGLALLAVAALAGALLWRDLRREQIT